MERIVVGVDGSACAAAALRWGLQEAKLRDCAVTAVMVWDYLGQHHPDGSTTFEPGYDAHAAEQALDSFVVAAVGPTDRTRLGTDLVFDLPVRGIVEASQSASLLVLGARGQGGFEELLLGSVSQGTLRGAACPVVVVRTPPAGEPTEHGRVVVGVDGSAGGDAALRWAGQEAQIRGAELRVVHAAPSAYVDVPLPDPVRVIDVVQREANAVLEQAILRCDLPASVKVHPLSATGSPAKALLQASRDADLVVVGRTGRSLLRDLLVGSVATQISHHSTIPAVFVSTNDTP
jgi:nucleotide-binding universal stress UspA family protein